MEQKSKTLIASLILNLVVFTLVVIASVFMFVGYTFMPNELTLQSTKIGMLKFFTVQSNIFVGIVALIFAVFEILMLRGKKEKMPKAMQIIKFVATSAVSLTFFVVFAYLGFIVKGGVVVLLANSNMFFHLIVPALAIITFVAFERSDVIRFRDATWGFAPAACYAMFYMTNVLVHLKNGQVDHKYDFYYFVQGDLWQIAIVVPLVLGISYGIGLLLWVANRRKK